MKPVTFITGNQNKVRYLEQYLEHPIKHVRLDLEELQTLDTRKIVEYKARQAYEQIGEPVLVEDGSLGFTALGGLPGPFIRFFIDNVPLATMCRMLDGMDRSAEARVTFGYYDGQEVRFFESTLKGTIAEHPAGENGWAWDKIFIPTGSSTTRAEFSDAEYEQSSQELRPLQPLVAFLTENA